MLIRLAILPDEVGIVREACMPGARGKLVCQQRKEALLLCNLMHQASSSAIILYTFAYILIYYIQLGP